MQSPSAIHLPEVLHLIALHLPPSDLLTCRFVCHLWDTIFTPYIARIIHDRAKLWSSSRQPSRLRNDLDEISSMIDAKNALRAAFIQKHKGHVRRLVIFEQWLLETALRTSLTQLTSLHIVAHFTSRTHGLNVLPDELFSDVPESIFAVTLYRRPVPLTLARTRATWQLIRNNPGLEEIWISSSARETLFGFATASPGVLTEEAERFAMSTLSRLTNLRRLHLGGAGVDSIILQRLPTDFPWITMFVYTGKAEDLNNLPSGFLCPTIQDFTIYATIGMKEIYQLLRIFPNLRSLDLTFSYSGKDSLDQSSIVHVTHPVIERFTASNIADIALLQLCFPKVKRIQPFNRIWDFKNVLSILRMLPGLEHLQALNVYGEGERGEGQRHGAADHNGGDGQETKELQLRTLIIQNHPWYPSKMSPLLARAPHLVKLEICYIPREAVATIAQTCKNLEHLFFDVTQRCSKEINQLFVALPNLKSLQGKGLAIMIDDMLQGPDWTCFGLEKLQCGIMGVPRLSSEEETFLRHVERKSPTSDDEDIKKNRIMTKQQESWAIQEQVFQHLARLKDLQLLDIGFVKLPCRQRHKRFVCTFDKLVHRLSNTPVPDSLELSMASGLAHLSTLHRLGTFGFKEADHRIGKREMQWMSEHWKLDTVFGFGGCIIEEEQIDREVDELCEAIRAIIPNVRVLENASKYKV
ncbi:hypothetical protein EC991_006360 [Linnemannia zychae]|nr:hypothetical protein EC991_006360 [Linnemannia zychae]